MAKGDTRTAETTTIRASDVDRANAETLIDRGIATSFSDACRIALALVAHELIARTPVSAQVTVTISSEPAPIRGTPR